MHDPGPAGWGCSQRREGTGKSCSDTSDEQPAIAQAPSLLRLVSFLGLMPMTSGPGGVQTASCLCGRRGAGRHLPSVTGHATTRWLCPYQARRSKGTLADAAQAATWARLQSARGAGCERPQAQGLVTVQPPALPWWLECGGSEQAPGATQAPSFTDQPCDHDQ